MYTSEHSLRVSASKLLLNSKHTMLDTSIVHNKVPTTGYNMVPTTRKTQGVNTQSLNIFNSLQNCLFDFEFFAIIHFTGNFNKLIRSNSIEYQ